MSYVSTLLVSLIPFGLGLGAGIALTRWLRPSARGDENGEPMRQLQGEIIALQTSQKNLAEQLSETKGSEADLRQSLQSAAERLARADEKISAFDQAQKAAREEFKNLASDILKQNSAEFKEQSKQSLEVLLTPLDKQLVEFKTEITGFKAINEKMTSETESLTNALTSNVKVQGNWGEMVLERILEESGLEKGREYTLQGEGLGLKSAEGARQMPDVIINLPEAKHIVIDSKVSLTSFREYQNASTEDQRAAAAKAFILSTEKHIKDLAGKNYQNAYGLQSLDFVMMFMPIEAAYFLLLSAREDILRQAWEKGISIVSPSNLFPNLKTIGYLWRLQKQNDNAEEIARLGGSVYDKVSGFLGDMQSVGKSLVKAQDTHREAVKKLSEGNGNVMRQAEKLRELGAKTNKSLPDMTDV
ncbi:MAG: DNA recombination protein RmuC [Alphaproteobacteria bacterium]|nr:DNA recombination protein RmuC [Alphaproteobacteria bacterium]